MGEKKFLLPKQCYYWQITKHSIYSGYQESDETGGVFLSRALIAAGGKKSFNLVGMMEGRVRSSDVLDPCPSHHFPGHPSTLETLCLCQLRIV